MTTIHHATRKRATESGVTLNVMEPIGGEDIFEAHWPKRNQRWNANNPKFSLAVALLSKTFTEEYPALTIQEHSPSSFEVYWTDAEGQPQTTGYAMTELAHVDMAEVLEICEDAGFDPESMKPDEEDSGGVVPNAYKRKYKEMGHPEHCGDWLATVLNSVCHITQVGKKGTFSVELFTVVLEANKVDTSGKWFASRTNGWQGRFRMTGRNLLAKVVADTEMLILPAELKYKGKDKIAKVVPPEDFCLHYATRKKVAKKGADKTE